MKEVYEITSKKIILNNELRGSHKIRELKVKSLVFTNNSCLLRTLKEGRTKILLKLVLLFNFLRKLINESSPVELPV